MTDYLWFLAAVILTSFSVILVVSAAFITYSVIASMIKERNEDDKWEGLKEKK